MKRLSFVGVFVLLMIAFISCEKENNDASNLQHSSPFSKNVLKAEKATVSPILPPTSEMKGYESFRYTFIEEAQLQLNDGKQWSGKTEVLELFKPDGSSEQLVTIGKKFFKLTETRFEIEEFIEQTSDRRMSYIGPVIICAMYAARVYDRALADFERDKNIICEYCALNESNIAMGQCLDGTAYSSKYSRLYDDFLIDMNL